MPTAQGLRTRRLARMTGVGLVSASVAFAGGTAGAIALDVEARHDKPGPVELELTALDFGGTPIHTETLVFAADDNSFGSVGTTLPASSSLLRITFVNDFVSGAGPDSDRNGYMDFLTIDGRVREAESWDRTGGTDSSFPGCAAVLLDGRVVADCGNANDFVEFGLDPHPGATILTHGFTYANLGETCPMTPPLSAWLFRMAEAIRARMGGLGDCQSAPAPVTGPTILEYDPCSGDWQTYCGSEDPAEPAILIFNWIQESDGANLGGTVGYTEAAGDALYAALRDASLPGSLAGTDLVDPDRGIHFIGHSRGTVVNSECVERLAAAGIPVDHVTTLDPHPVDGSPPPDWGDPEPRVWTNTIWSDNYWRADPSPIDFDGQPIDGAYDRNLECVIDDPPEFEHSTVHAWYHGTIDLSATQDGTGVMIEPTWYDDDGSGAPQCDPIPPRDSTGYYFAPGVGAALRPDHLNQPGHVAPVVTPRRIVNGDFELTGPSELDLGHAGWRYHGGNLTGTTLWASEVGGNHYAKLSSSLPSIEHNRLYVDPDVERLRLRIRRDAAVVATDDVVEFYVRPPGQPGAEQVFASFGVTGLPARWIHRELDVDAGSLGTVRILGVRIVDPNGLALEGRVDIDDLEFLLVGDATPVPGLGPAGLAGLAAALGATGLTAWRRGSGKPETAGPRAARRGARARPGRFASRRPGA